MSRLLKPWFFSAALLLALCSPAALGMELVHVGSLSALRHAIASAPATR